MKIRKLIATLLVFLVGLSTAGLVFTFAWLAVATTNLDIGNLNGGVISQYFDSGTGTEQDPYVITRPVHLYNLTELYDKYEGFAEEDNYFRLGKDLDNTGELKFYNYDDYGVYQETYSDSLNMSFYENFRPIGSEDKPFGGNFDGSNLTIDNLNISGSGVSDIGVFGYVTSEAKIKDLYIDNLDIDITDAIANAHDIHNNAYVGYIAGHVDNARSFTNTYVNNCNISGNSVLTKNDWGYYGHCENAATIEEFIMRANGENAGWGGSVNMQKMYDRLYDIAGQSTTNNNYAFEKDIVTKIDNTTFERDSLTGYAYTYRSQKEGSFVFTRYSAQNGPRSNYMYLNGGTRYHQYRQAETQVTNGYKISYNNHYLGVSGTTISDHDDAWEFSNNLLSIYINNVQYYLTHNLTLSTTTQETWTRNGNRLYYTTGGIFGIGGTSHYLIYNNGWTTTTTRTNLTWANATYTKIVENSSGSDYMDYTGTNVTYFPLITNPDSYEVARKNTGYVIGGSEDNTTSAYPDKTGDIRVSKYATSDINRSYSNGNLTNVYTINSNLQTTTINANDYIKYEESKAEFLDSITSGNIYGLHFMPANININHLVTADYTLINGEEKTNYKMPASSIDFNVMEKGFINFFAGTYFSGNNSFFSLHHIERDENNEITSIKEISEIYKSSDDTKDYIYKYANNSYTETLTSDYSLIFSTNRIKRQSSVTTNAVYYFEIPVNAGEFALGSVSGGTGAYLMYLDIATNGGIDQQANVDTFGSIDYRSSIDVVENSILLITYELSDEQSLNISVSFSNNIYHIFATSDNTIQILITTLSTDYKYY